MQSINLETWDEVRDWIDNYSIKPSTIEQINSGLYPKDAFSLGQIASKLWLINTLCKITPLQPNPTVAMLGCWIASLAPMLHDSLLIERVYGIDSDPHAIELSEKFNRRLVENEWKYKGIVYDVDLLMCNSMEFITSGTAINVKPNWIINTSCEHMSTDWFDTVDSDQLIIMQTNDSPDYEGHVNTCCDAEDMIKKYPLDNVLYIGGLTLPSYTRYMQIGYK